MRENPYESPKSETTVSPTANLEDEAKIRSDLEKAIKVRKYLLIAIPIVAANTAFQYLGFFSPGNLPDWFGLIVLAVCAIQVPVMSRKIAKLERSLR